MERAFGPELARCIRCRLAVLHSAPVLDLVSGDPPISLAQIGRPAARYSVALGESHRLEFEATKSTMATRDGSAVIAITIIGVKAAPPCKERTP